MLIRNTAWSFGAQIVRLATTLLLIALLDPAARGLQSLLILLPTLTAVLTMLGIGSATPVVMYRDAQDDRLVGVLMGLGLIVVGVVTLILVPLLPFLARYLSDPQQYTVSTGEVAIGFLFFPPTLLGDYMRSFLSARRDLRAVAINQGLQAMIQLALALVLVVGLGAGPMGAVWATVIAGWAGFFAAAQAVRAYGSLWPRFDRDVLRPLLSLGLRGHAGNIVQTFNYRLDALLVQGYLGQTAVGLYQTGVTLAEMVWYLPNAVSAALMPEIAATAKTEVTPRVARHTLALTLLAALGLVVVAWPVLTYLRPAYQGAFRPLCILLIGVAALSVHKVISSDLLGRGLPQYPLYTSSLALVVTIIADIVLIPRWGIMGAAWASTSAYVLQTLVLLVLYLRFARIAWYDVLLLRVSDLGDYRRLVLRLRRGA